MKFINPILICILVMVYDSSFSQTQSILCQNFDDSLVTTQSDIANTFFYHTNTWLSHWSVTDGTPSVESNGTLSGINAYDGTQYATVGVCGDSNGTDGLQLLFDFQAHQTYTISLAACNWSSASNQTVMDYYLLGTPLVHTYDSMQGCTSQYVSYDPVASGTGTLVYTSTPTNQWALQSFTFTPDSDCHSLWMKVHTTTLVPTNQAAEYCFDSLCINQVISSALCQNFDDSLVTTQSDIANTFFYHTNTWLSHWSVTDGTPSVESNGTLTGINAYDGTQYATVGVCGDSNGTDGLQLLFDFQAHQTYTISLAACNWSSASNQTVMDYYLLGTPLVHTYDSMQGCTSQYVSYDPVASGTGTLVYTSTPTNQWALQSFTFTPDSDCHSLWMKVHTTTLVPTNQAAEYCFDSLCINESLAASIVEPSARVPSFLQVAPNPFSNSTRVGYYLSSPASINYVLITDLTGRVIKRFILSSTTVGNIEFDSQDISSGVYLCSLVANERIVISQKMVILH